MKTSDFRTLSSTLKEMTPHQRQVMMDRLQPAAQVPASYQLVETWRTETPLAGLRHKAKWIDYPKQLR